MTPTRVVYSAPPPCFLPKAHDRAACGSVSRSLRPRSRSACSARPPRTQRESKKYGGTLVVGLVALDPGSLDPTLLGGGQGAYEVAKSFREQLYDYDRRARIVPQLAAALPTISKDKLTYTIPLRRGIVFNDGTPFDAEAVVESLRRVIDLPASPRANQLAAIDSVAASGPYEVAIHLKTRFTPPG